MHGHRVVAGLRWARECMEGKPKCIPMARPRKACKKAGIAYEKALAAAIPTARHGVWWEFEDHNGHGYCQTDLILDHHGQLVVVEAKSTWVPEAIDQLRWLYLPVVEQATGQRPIGIIACRRLVPEAARACQITQDFWQAVKFASEGSRTPVLHWIGRGPIEVERPRAPMGREVLAASI